MSVMTMFRQLCYGSSSLGRRLTLCDYPSEFLRRLTDIIFLPLPGCIKVSGPYAYWVVNRINFNYFDKYLITECELLALNPSDMFFFRGDKAAYRQCYLVPVTANDIIDDGSKDSMFTDAANAKPSVVQLYFKRFHIELFKHAHRSP